MTRRDTTAITVLVLGIIAAAGVRLWAADGRELWYDDIGRIQQALVPWDRLWDLTPKLGNLKSPYLVALHRSWIDVFGTGSILAVRGQGIFWGIVMTALAAGVAGRVLGPWAAAATAWVYALDPFFVRWSVEVHNYAPAGCATLAAWFVALRPGGLRTAGFLGVVALGALAAALFPPAAVAVAPLIAVRDVRAGRSPIVWAGAVMLAAAVAAPALWSIAESQGHFGRAFAEGRGWAPYFNPRKTPFEVLGRFAGLDLRQGSFSRPLAAWAVAAVGGSMLCLLLSADRRTDPERWRRRGIVAFAGVVALAVLTAVSVVWIGVFTDRYVHAAAAMAPLAAVVAVWPGAADRGPAGRVLRGLAGAVLLAPLALGVRKMVADGPSFPRDLTARSYRCAALLDREFAGVGAPQFVFVHGEAQFSHVLLRSRVAIEKRTRVVHLSTAAWVSVLREGDMSKVDVPPSYGWPFNAQIVAGGPATVDTSEVRRRLDEGARLAIVFEQPPLVRGRFLEAEEATSGAEDAWRAAAEAPSIARDARIAAAVRKLCGRGPDARVTIRSEGTAILVVVEP